jgi:hypothetical protein
MKLLYQEQKRLIEIRDALHQTGKIRQQTQSDLELIVAMIAYIKRKYPRVKDLDIVKNHLLSFQK